MYVCCWCRFEKYIGGKYLGSLLTSALSALARAGLFPAAPTPDVLQTAHLSLFEKLVAFTHLRHHSERRQVLVRPKARHHCHKDLFFLQLDALDFHQVMLP